MAHKGAGDRDILIYLYSNKLAFFSINNSFGLRKNFSHKSKARFFKPRILESLAKLSNIRDETFSKNLEKYLWMNSFLELANLLKIMNFFLGIF